MALPPPPGVIILSFTWVFNGHGLRGTVDGAKSARVPRRPPSAEITSNLRTSAENAKRGAPENVRRAPTDKPKILGPRRRRNWKDGELLLPRSPFLRTRPRANVGKRARHRAHPYALPRKGGSITCV